MGSAQVGFRIPRAPAAALAALLCLWLLLAGCRTGGPAAGPAQPADGVPAGQAGTGGAADGPPGGPGQAPAPAQGPAEGPAQGSGQGPAQGSGQGPAQGSGQGPAQGPGDAGPSDPAAPPAGQTAADTPGVLDTVPQGAQVYVGTRYLGVTPLPLPPGGLGEFEMLTLVAPGRQVLHHWLNAGDNLELFDLAPLPEVPAAVVARERERLLAGVAAQAAGDSWQLRFRSAYWIERHVSPDGRYLAMPVKGEATPAGWALDLLIAVDLASGRVQVLEEQLRYPMLPGNGADGITLGLRAAGWRDAGRLVAVRAAERAPGAELIYAVDEYDPAGARPPRRLAEFPLTVRGSDFDALWVAGDALYLVSYQFRHIDLERGQVSVWKERMPVFEPSGTVPVAVSPDGARLLYGFLPEGMLDLETGRDLPFRPAGSESGQAEFSPDGRRIAQWVSGRTGRWCHGVDASWLLAGAIRILDREGREAALLHAPEGRLVRDLRFTPDAGALVVKLVQDPGDDMDCEAEQPADAGLHLLRLSDGSWTELRPPAADIGWPLAVSGGWAAEYDTARGTVRYTAWEGPPPPAPPGPIAYQVLLLPDGRLAVQSADDRRTIWTCAPGAAACTALAEPRGGGDLTPAGPWLTSWWRDGAAYFLAGVRWQAGEPAPSP